LTVKRAESLYGILPVFITREARKKKENDSTSFFSLLSSLFSLLSSLSMITSPQNPKIKLARALQKRREREREGKLFLEGIRLVRDALTAGIVPDTLFYTQAAVETAEGAALVGAWETTAWEVSPEMMVGMSETVTPQGIAAIVPLPQLAWAEIPTLLVIADQVRDPGNLGTLLRSAAGAGVDGFIVSSGTVDVWNEKVLRAGMGAHFRIPIREGLAWDKILPLVEGMKVYVAEAEGSLPYDAVQWHRPAVLLVGGEAEGASVAGRLRADAAITIPMVNGVESLNAGVAGSIILFEAARQRRH
jgi:TrmH family RNA methyltransferase